MAEQRAAGTRFNWCVADAETDLGLGNLTLFRLEQRHRRTRLLAHPDAQGRGIIVEALALVLVIEPVEVSPDQTRARAARAN